MRIDELIIGEDKTVLDAMHQLNDTGRAILFVAPGRRAAGRGDGRGRAPVHPARPAP